LSKAGKFTMDKRLPEMDRNAAILRGMTFVKVITHDNIAVMVIRM